MDPLSWNGLHNVALRQPDEPHVQMGHIQRHLNLDETDYSVTVFGEYIPPNTEAEVSEDEVEKLVMHTFRTGLTFPQPNGVIWCIKRYPFPVGFRKLSDSDVLLLYTVKVIHKPMQHTIRTAYPVEP